MSALRMLTEYVAYYTEGCSMTPRLLSPPRCSVQRGYQNGQTEWAHSPAVCSNGMCWVVTELWPVASPAGTAERLKLNKECLPSA